MTIAAVIVLFIFSPLLEIHAHEKFLPCDGRSGIEDVHAEQPYVNTSFAHKRKSNDWFRQDETLLSLSVPGRK